MQENVNLNIPPDVKPLFAGEVNVQSGFKVSMDANETTKAGKKDEITKVGRIDLFFIDPMSRSVISRMVIDPLTARDLGNFLLEHSKQVLDEMKNSDVPDHVREQLKEAKKQKASSGGKPQTYIG